MRRPRQLLVSVTKWCQVEPLHRLFGGIVHGLGLSSPATIPEQVRKQIVSDVHKYRVLVFRAAEGVDQRLSAEAHLEVIALCLCSQPQCWHPLSLSLCCHHLCCRHPSVLSPSVLSPSLCAVTICAVTVCTVSLCTVTLCGVSLPLYVLSPSLCAVIVSLCLCGSDSGSL